MLMGVGLVALQVAEQNSTTRGLLGRGSESFDLPLEAVTTLRAEEPWCNARSRRLPRAGHARFNPDKSPYDRSVAPLSRAIQIFRN